MCFMFPGSRRKQRFPTGDGAGAIPCLVVVRDAGKQSAELYRRGQFAAPSESRADRVGFGLRDSEHSWSMAVRAWHGNKTGCRLTSCTVSRTSIRETRLSPRSAGHAPTVSKREAPLSSGLVTRHRVTVAANRVSTALSVTSRPGRRAGGASDPAWRHSSGAGRGTHGLPRTDHARSQANLS